MTLQSGRYSAWNGATPGVAARFAGDAARLGLIIATISALVLVGASLVALRLGPSRPDAAGWLGAALAFVGLSASIALPLGVAAGPALALQAWVDSGAWDGARVAGIRGAILALPALLVGTAAVPLFVIEHRWAPECRTYLETAPLGRFVIAPGRALSTPLGDAVGLPTATLIIGEDRALIADRVAAGRRGGVPVVVFSGVHARVGDAAITAEHLVLPLDLPGSFGARSDAALASSPEGYAAEILAKRTLHPVTTGILGAALLPLGAGPRPWLWIALLAVSVLITIRVADALSWRVGAGAAALEPAWIMAVGCVLWARWRDR